MGSKYESCEDNCDNKLCRIGGCIYERGFANTPKADSAGTKPPPPTVRVIIVGDHPWVDHIGWIKPKDGGYETLQVLGTPPTLYKVMLDNGHMCYAELKHMQRIETQRPTSPPLICSMCGKTFLEDDMYGSPWDDAAVLCSKQCACDFNKSQESKHHDE